MLGFKQGDSPQGTQVKSLRAFLRQMYIYCVVLNFLETKI